MTAVTIYFSDDVWLFEKWHFFMSDKVIADIIQTESIRDAVNVLEDALAIGEARAREDNKQADIVLDLRHIAAVAMANPLEYFKCS